MSYMQLNVASSITKSIESDKVKYNENVHSHLLCVNTNIFPRWRIAHFILIINRTHSISSLPFHSLLPHMCMSRMCSAQSNQSTQSTFIEVIVYSDYGSRMQHRIYRLGFRLVECIFMELKYSKKTKMFFFQQISMTLWNVLTFWPYRTVRRIHR